MLSLKKTITPIMSAFVVSTALVGFAQAEGSFNGDANGEEPIMPGAEVTAEAQADAPVATSGEMVGDLSGEEPLTRDQQLKTNAEARAEAADDLPADGTEKIYGDLSGDQPTNQPMIESDDS